MLCICASPVNATVPKAARDHADVMPIESTLHHVAANVQRLMDAYPDLGTQPKLAERAGVDQTTISRLLRAERSATIGTLDAVARAFGLEVWKLLLPDFDPADPPGLVLRSSQRDAWRTMRVAAEEIARYGASRG